MSAKPKICFITASELTVRCFLLGHLAALSKIYEVTLIVNTDNPDFLRDTNLAIRVLPVGIERKISLWRDGLALIKLIRVFSCEHFAAVHSVTPKAGFLAMVAATICRVPLRIHTFTGQVWVTHNGLARLLLKSLDTITARLTTHLLTDGEAQRQFLIDEHVTLKERVRVLGKGSFSGVDVVRFSPNQYNRKAVREIFGIVETDLVFVYIGRLNFDKGLLDLATAFAKVAQPNWHCLIVGPDEVNLIPIIKLQCQAVATQIHFAGSSHAPEVEMAAADVLCLPSYREGFSTVLIEAAAMGVPALASRIYGITDTVVEGETGLLHEPKVINEIAEKMQLLASNMELRNRLGECAMLRAKEDFSQTYVTGELVKFYESVLY